MQCKQNKNGVKLLAAVAVLAMMFAACAVVIGTDSDTDAATNEQKYSGTVDAVQNFPAGTNIVINDTLKITKGGIMTVEGSLKVLSGVSVTIEEGGKLVVKGGLVTIDGTVLVTGTDSKFQVMEHTLAADEILFKDYGITLNGTMTVTKNGVFEATSTPATPAEPDAEDNNGTEEEEIQTTDAGEDVAKQSILVKDGAKLDITKTGSNVGKIDNIDVYVSVGGTFHFSGKTSSQFDVTAYGDSKYMVQAIASIIGGTSATSDDKTTSDLTFTVKSGKITGYYNDTTVKTVSLNDYNLVVTGAVKNNDTLSFSEKTTLKGEDVKVTGYIYTSKNATPNENAAFTGATEASPYKLATNPGDIVFGKVIIDNLTVDRGSSITNGSAFGDKTDNLTYLNVRNVPQMVVTGTLTFTASEKDKTNGATFLDYGYVQVQGTINAEYSKVNVSYTQFGGVVIDGGKVILSDYSNGNFNGSIGAAYIDNDENYIITDLQTAIDGAVGSTDKEVIVIGGYKSGKSEGVGAYVISKDMTIPDGITLTLDRGLLIKDGVTLTVSPEAAIEFSDKGAPAPYCMIFVEGQLVDNDTNIAETSLSFEVKTSNADETVFTYTSLKNAIANANEGDTIYLYNQVDVKNNLTIPAGITVDSKNNKIVIANDATLTVDGTIYLSSSDGKIILTDASGTKAAGKLVINNMVVADATQIIDSKEEPNTAYVAGIYAEGTIGDYKDKDFILAPAVAAENSKTLENLEILGKTTYSSDLTFTAEAENEITLTIKAEAVFGKITLDGYKIVIENDNNTIKGVLSATVIAETTDGSSSVKFDKVSNNLEVKVTVDDTQEEPVSKMSLMVVADTSTLTGNITIASGKVYLNSAMTVGTTSKDVMTVANGAELNVPSAGSIIVAVQDGDKAYSGLVIDGTLSATGTITTNTSENNSPGTVLVNGTMVDSKGQSIAGNIDVIGTLTISSNKTMTVAGTMTVGKAPESLGAASTVTGALNVTGKLIVYPGADMSGALINVVDGVSTSKKVDYFVNGSLYMTSYSPEATEFSTIIPETLKITGYEDVVFNSTTSMWYTIPEMDDDSKKLDNNDTVGDISAVYGKATPSEAYLKASIGTGISLWIDGVKYTSGQVFTLNVGEYNVEVTINPGYKGTAKVMFNGAEVTNGKLVVTPEMSKTSTENTPVIVSATGDIAIDNGSSSGSSSSDDGMGITDILLIVLVILAAILVVIVALRMMRN